MSPHHLKWKREHGEWIGRAACGKHLFTVVALSGVGAKLYRAKPGEPYSSCQRVSSVTRAKDMADELARLANYPALSVKPAPRFPSREERLGWPGMVGCI